MGIVVELQVEQTPPEDFVGFLANPALDPADGFYVIQRTPVIALGGKERMETITKLRKQAEPRESEQGNWVTPWLHLALVPITHTGFHPVNSVSQIQFVQHLQKCVIRNTVEMVVTFDG
ncbi:hypothetical protein D3C78_1380380 [compost metagenome]